MLPRACFQCPCLLDARHLRLTAQSQRRTKTSLTQNEVCIFITEEASQNTPQPLLLASSPEVQTCNHILTQVVLVSVQNLVVYYQHESPAGKINTGAYLSGTRMQHPDILPHHDRHQASRLHIPNLDETWLECQYIRSENRKRCRIPFPIDNPFLSRSPTVAIDEEAKVGVAEEKLGRQSLDVDGLDGLAARNKVERRVCLVQQVLRFERLEGDDLETTRAANAELRFEKVDAVRVGWDVEFLEDRSTTAFVRESSTVHLPCTVSTRPALQQASLPTPTSSCPSSSSPSARTP